MAEQSGCGELQPGHERPRIGNLARRFRERHPDRSGGLGKVPLYNVVVYVPSSALAPIPDGAACETCATPISGNPVAATITDARGRFTLENVPSGQNIPIALQVGKWRRELKIPEVKACQDNGLSDPNLFRLPRNRNEGHIPKIALVAGDADRLQCLLYRMGLESSVSGLQRSGLTT